MKNTRPLLSENATVVSDAFDTCSPSLSAWKLTNAKRSNRLRQCWNLGHSVQWIGDSEHDPWALGFADLVFFHKLGDGGEAAVR